MSENYDKIKSVVLVTVHKISRFPFHDPDNPSAGPEFLSDCRQLGWKTYAIGTDLYVFANKRSVRP